MNGECNLLLPFRMRMFDWMKTEWRNSSLSRPMPIRPMNSALQHHTVRYKIMCRESTVYNILSYRFIRALRQRQRNAYIVKTGICNVWLAVWYTRFSLIAPHRIKADINKRTAIRQPHQNNSKFCIWKHFSFHNEIEWKKEHNIIVKPLWFRCIYHTPWIAISYQCLTLGMHVYDCKPCDTHPNIQVVEKQIDTKIHKKTQPTIWIYK